MSRASDGCEMKRTLFVGEVRTNGAIVIFDSAIAWKSSKMRLFWPLFMEVSIHDEDWVQRMIIPVRNQDHQRAALQSYRTYCESVHSPPPLSIDDQNGHTLIEAIPFSTESVEEQIAARNVRYLCHFTRIENLAGILCHGLLSVNELKRMSVEFNYNDQYRLDHRTDYISLSVAFPNYRLFFKNRSTSQTTESSWVVLILRPSVCWELPVLFCATNAASSRISRSDTRALEGSKAFRELFDDGDQGIQRSARGLTDDLTWDPQAEVLVPQHIPVEYISTIVFFDREFPEAKQHAQRREIRCVINQRLYGKRVDWLYWQQGS